MVSGRILAKRRERQTDGHIKGGVELTSNAAFSNASVVYILLPAATHVASVVAVTVAVAVSVST